MGTPRVKGAQPRQSRGLPGGERRCDLKDFKMQRRVVEVLLERDVSRSGEGVVPQDFI